MAGNTTAIEDETRPAAFWQPNGKLRPEIQAHIQRLRDFRTQQGRLGIEARQLRKQLQRSSKD